LVPLLYDSISVILILITPPWRHNHVSEVVERKIYDSSAATVQEFHDSIYAPVVAAVVSFIDSLVYCSYGYWRHDFPKLVARTRDWFKTTIVSPIVQFFLRVKRGVLYVVLGQWVPPLVAYFVERWTDFQFWLNSRIVEPAVRKFTIVKNCVIYYVCLHWLPPLIVKVKHEISGVCCTVDRKVLQPTKDFLCDARSFLVYWLGGYWIEPLKLKIRACLARIVHEVQMMVASPWQYTMNLVDMLIYCATLQWLPAAWICFDEKICQPTLTGFYKLVHFVRYFLYGYFLTDLRDFAYCQLNRLETYLIDQILKPGINYASHCIENIKQHVKQLASACYQRLLSMLQATKQRLVDLAVRTECRARLCWQRSCDFMYHSVLVPSRRHLRRLAIKTKLYLKYRIVLPTVKNLLLGTLALLEFSVCRIVLPLAELLLMLIGSACTAFMDEYGYHYWDLFVDSIPDWLVPKGKEISQSDERLSSWILA